MPSNAPSAWPGALRRWTELTCDQGFTPADFQTEVQRLIGNLDQQALSLLQAPGAVNPGPAPKVSAPPAVGVGPGSTRGAGVAQVADQLLGHQNSEYYRADPANACASFVSTVLIRAGVFQGPEQQVGGGSDFTRSASQLASTLASRGAQLVLNRAPVSDPATAGQLRAGDILLWTDGAGYHHSGISLGGDQMVAISSSHGKVESHNLAWPGYSLLSAYRLP